MPKTIETFTGDLLKLFAKFEADKARHDRMVALVERMLKLNKRVAAAFRPPRRGVRLKADAT